jgi:hypothetical protein
VKELLAQMASGMTLTQLPRSQKDAICHRVTLISMKGQLAYWKDRPSDIEKREQWEEASQAEIEVWGGG